MNETIKKLLNDGKITQEEYDILFFSKQDWFVFDEEGKQDWSSSNTKQIAFWKSIKKVKYFFDNTPQNFKKPPIYDFSFIKFPPVLIHNSCIVTPNELFSEFSDHCLSASFYKAIFYGEINIFKSEFKIDLDFRECLFKDSFSLVTCKIKGIDFSNATFNKKTSIKKSIFVSGAKFNNVIFYNDITFEESHFKDHVNLTITSAKKSIFNDLTFEKIASFGGAIFSDSVSFKYCNFNSFTDFTKTGFNKQAFFSNVFFHDVHFIETFFLTNVTFIFLKADYFIMRNPIIKNLKINNSFIKNSDIDRLFSTSKTQNKHKLVSLSKQHISDRQTARFLKNLYDNQKNIPNSNQLFAIEQDYFIDEINRENILDTNKIPKLATLYLNKWVSNFGTDWVRPLLVIFIFGFISSFFYNIIPLPEKTDITLFSTCTNVLWWSTGGFLFSILLYISYQAKEWWLLTIFILSYIVLLISIPEARSLTNDISKLINPLNIFKTKDYFEHIAPYGMFVKLIMATLIYQFIMAFRQNTRRK